MSHHDEFYQSTEEEDSKTNPESEKRPGATCAEITEETSQIMVSSSLQNIENEENCNTVNFPIPPPSSPTFPTLYNDLFGQGSYSRRFSCLPPESENTTYFPKRSRTPSLPTLDYSSMQRDNQDSNYKKLLFDNSRRSSFESAYHSRSSVLSSRTPVPSSQLEDMEYSQEYTERLFNENTQSMFTDMSLDENLERTMIERRNSLSYEAIRAYFLEFNPYMHPVDTGVSLLDQLDSTNMLLGSSGSERRGNNEYINSQFRTNAHRQVVEHQFEELFNIPDFSRSRATSIDLFGGIGVPFVIQEQSESVEECTEDEIQKK